MKRAIKSIVAASAAIFMCAAPMATSVANILPTGCITASAYYIPNAFDSFDNDWTPTITGVTEADLNRGINLGHVDYRFDIQNKTASVQGIDRADSRIKIPARLDINGQYYNVTSIANGAFRNKDGKRLPNGDAAPMGAPLTKIDLSAATYLTSIGNEAFQNCTSLESLTIPASVRTIGTKAFENSGIRTLRLERISALSYSSLVLKDRAFADCKKLTHITNNVTRFTDTAYGIVYDDSSANAFDGCEKKNITIGTSYRVIGYKEQFVNNFKRTFNF